MGKKYRPMFARKKSHKLRNTIICLVLVVVAFLGFVAYADVFAGLRNDDTAVSVYFPAEATESDIIEILKDNEIIKYPVAFKVCSLLGGSSYVNGSHILKKSMTYQQILDTIKTKNNSSIIAVVVNDGATIDDIALVVADELELSVQDFYEALKTSEYPVETSRTDKKLEGYLLPGTYNFTKGTDAYGVVSSMLARFDEFLTEETKSRISQKNLTVDNLLTIASLVEAKADSKENMPAVAEEILYKLNNGEALNSEAALKYSLKKTELTENDKKIDTPYNTFINTGLPKGPVCSPSQEAIEAVLR